MIILIIANTHSLMNYPEIIQRYATLSMMYGDGTW